MPRFETPLQLQNIFIEFAGDKVPDVAPTGKARLYYDQGTGRLMTSLNGASYSAGGGTRLRDLSEYYLPGPPLNSAVSSLVIFGSVGALAGASANGTWLGINHSSSTPDYLNFQVAGTSKYRVYGTGSVDMAGTLTLGTGAAAISADSGGTITAGGVSTAANILRAGRGKPLGNPTGTPSAATNGAGSLNGVYQYAYTEYDGSGSGETGLSPVGSISPSNNTVRVTMPLPRRGTDRRRLYRTAAGGSIFKLVHDFGGASGYFQTLWDDNTADGSLGATAPSSDTTALYELMIAAGVKHWSTHPDQGTAAADVTILTADPSTPGSYAVDAYGEYYSRCPDNGSVCFGALKTGTSGYFIYCEANGILDDGSAAVQKFSVDTRGNCAVVPSTLVDGGSNALKVQAAFPATITANTAGAYFALTGAGSSAFAQSAVAIDMLAGFTGNSTAYGLNIQQATANVGAAAASIGLQGKCTGASPQNCGLSGVASGGTQNVGVWGGLNAVPDSIAASFAMGCNNGVVSADSFRAYDNGSIRFRVRAGGGNYTIPAIAAPGALSTGDFWLDSTQKCLEFFAVGTQQRLSGLMFTQSADAVVANTTSETTLKGAIVGTASVGQFGALLVAGKTLRLRAFGYLSSTGAPNLTINVKLGSTSVCTTGAVAQSGTPTNVGWELDVMITCRTTGVSGTVIAQGIFRYGSTFMTLVSTAATTIDTTVAQIADWLATWSVQAAGNTITCTSSALEVLN